MLAKGAEVAWVLSVAWLVAWTAKPELWDGSYLLWIALSVFAAGARWGHLAQRIDPGPGARWIAGTIMTSVFVGMLALGTARLAGAKWESVNHFEFRFVMVGVCAYFSDQVLRGLTRLAERWAGDPAGVLAAAVRRLRRSRGDE